MTTHHRHYIGPIGAHPGDDIEPQTPPPVSVIDHVRAAQLLHHSAAQESLAQALLDAAGETSPGISAAVWQAHEEQKARLDARPGRVRARLTFSADLRALILLPADTSTEQALRALGPMAEVEIHF